MPSCIVSAMGFPVKKKQCKTCIYFPSSPLVIEELEDEVRDKHVGFAGYRICHEDTGDGSCCRGFWDRHKDKFSVGQVAQRLNLVDYVD